MAELTMAELMRDTLKKVLLVGLVLMLAWGMLGIMLNVAKADTPHGQNPYPYGKSTYWAWQNRPDLPGSLGDAKDWDSNAAELGWPVSDYPRKGDVVVFKPGVLGADSVSGHVAVVQQVYNDGSYLTSQMDESDCPNAGAPTCGQINKRVYPALRGVGFIHYKKDSRTTWGFAGGGAGWTAKDLGEGSMGGPGWYYPLAGDGPQLVSPDLEIPLDGYNAVQIDMVTGVPVADPTVRVFFATASQPDFTGANSVAIRAVADGQLHRYTAYFGANPAWQGQLIRLRIDPAGPSSSGGVRMDRVSLISLEPDGYTTLSEGGPIKHRAGSFTAKYL